ATGDGAVIDQLLAEGAAQVVVVERFPDILSKALAHFEWSQAIREGRLSFEVANPIAATWDVVPVIQRFSDIGGTAVWSIVPGAPAIARAMRGERVDLEYYGDALLAAELIFPGSVEKGLIARLRRLRNTFRRRPTFGENQNLRVLAIVSPGT